MSLKIVFAGTPEFSVPTIQTLIHSSHELLAVYTQPDRPAGRGQKIQASPVKQLADACKIPVFQPKTLRDESVQAELKKLNPDVMVVVAYGLILPDAVLSIPKLGCINVHPSLLPRWRGAAPIPRSIEAGDLETGVTIMQMDKGMDTGPILKQKKIKLSGTETSENLHTIFSAMGAQLLLTTLNELEKKSIASVAQDDALATYAEKIDKKEAIMNWGQSAITLNNKIRAFNSWPVTHTTFNKVLLKIWKANPLAEKTLAQPGTLVRVEKEKFCVATGDGVLEILTVQLPGKKPIAAKDFICGHAASLIVGKTKFI